MRKLFGFPPVSSAPSPVVRERVGPAVEALETRRLFAVLTVNSIADNDTRDSVLTFREAINLVNGKDTVAGLTAAETAQIDFSQHPVGTNDTIKFNIPGAGRQVIQVSGSGLPSISKPVTVDGYSQPGSAAATSKAAATVLIDLDGVNVPNATGLTIESKNVTIRGLSVTHFIYGFFLGTKSGDDTIAGNWVGITGASAFALLESPNGWGIYDNASTGNIIGGTTPADRNVISGNQEDGIDLGFAASKNVIEGNYIGVDPTGTEGITNATGIEINTDSANNTIGGMTSGARNVISNNNGDGVYIDGTNVSNTTIEGNYIGTNAAGTAALGNGAYGIAIAAGNDESGYVIGGATAGARNVISGNHGSGIFLDSGTYADIWGNYIGLSANGNSAIGNDSDGIYLNEADAEIGGSASGEGNVIGGNGGVHQDGRNDGIEVQHPSAALFIQRNRVGTNAAGTAAIGNKGDGIYVESGKLTYIGDDIGGGNVISGNGGDGISLLDSTYTIVAGDSIGVLADGKTAAGNKYDGVGIDGASSNSSIGGAGKSGANIIANNGRDGVEVTAGPGGTPVMNAIRQNSIYNNGALGIDLDYIYFTSNEVGVNLNDPGDTDSGANDYQNFPVITAAAHSSSAITIAGSLNSLANTAFNIDLYASAKADSTGYGEGQQYIGTIMVTTNSTGNVGFNRTFNVAIGSNVYISGTATTASGNGETSEFAQTIKAIGASPAAPGNLKAVANSATQVTLTWADNSSNETKFEVQRSTSSSFTSPTTFTVAANATTYVDKTASKSTTYYYRVRAVNAAGDSAYATAVKITTLSTSTPLATPTGLAGKALAGLAVTLTWKDNASGETGYLIEVSTSSTFSTLVKNVTVATPNLSTYKVTGLKARTYYCFRVRAVSTTTPALNSAWSSSLKLLTMSA